LFNAQKAIHAKIISERPSPEPTTESLLNLMPEPMPEPPQSLPNPIPAHSRSRHPGRQRTVQTYNCQGT
jgi:hypothetical protein